MSNKHTAEAITEADVKNWMLGRMREIRETLPTCTNFDVCCYWYGHMEEPQFGTSLHAERECVTSEPDTVTALEKLMRQLGRTAERAKSKRDEAAKLLAEAEALEALTRAGGAR